MDFEDRRVGFEERFSGLSEGQRYALALVLNLAFVGVVIAGFALLYTTGFDSRPSTAAAETPQVIADEGEETVLALADTSAGGPESLPGIPSEAPLSAEPQELAALGALPSETPPATTPESSTADAASAPTPRLSPNAERAETPVVAAAALSTPPAATAVPPAATGDVGAQWASAGELLLSLQRDFPCSRFTTQPGADGRPFLRARVGPSDDIAQVRTKVATVFSATASDVDVGIGCTTVIGGGYVALSDEKGSVLLLDSATLSREVRAVLPSDGTCAVIGQVVGTQPILEQRLETTGAPATWVRSSGATALCERTSAGSWRVVSAGARSPDRRAAALVIGDDVVASETLRAANLAPPTTMSVALPTPSSSAATPSSASTSAPLASTTRTPATTPSTSSDPATTTPSGTASLLRGADIPVPTAPTGDPTMFASTAAAVTPRTAPTRPATDSPVVEEEVAALSSEAVEPSPPPVASSSAPVEVVPIEGPQPKLPEGVASSPEGYAVEVAFTVDDRGRAENLSVVGAGTASVPVVAEALEIVSDSRFPSAERGKSYRGSYTVKFPSADIENLLTALDAATETAASEATPVWDRGPSQADYDRYYPARALQRGVAGEVALSCKIGFDGKLDCSVARENPGSWGFGGAALSLGDLMRAGPRMSDGRPSANETVEIEFMFSPGE